MTLSEIMALPQGARVACIRPERYWPDSKGQVARSTWPSAWSARVVLTRPNYNPTAERTRDGDRIDMTVAPTDWERIDEWL